MKLRTIGLAAATALATSAICSTQALAFNIDRGIEGYWWEPDLNARRGWSFQYAKTGPEQGSLFVTGFVYDDAGNPSWVTGNALVVDGQHEVDITLNLLEGGSFGPDAGAPVVVDDNWANLNVVFNSCNSADFTFSGDNVNFSQDFDSFLSLVGGSNEDKCIYQSEFEGCPSFATAGPIDRTCILSGTYLEDIHLSNDTVWLLDGGVFIGEKAAIGDPVPEDGPVMSIEAGTRVMGLGGSANALYISRGSKLIAEGQPHAPIVFTGTKTASEGASSGDWGGLVINGAAPLNTCDAELCEAVGEGDSGAYGGIDPYDNSGVLRYVRVQFAGEKINDEDELNGIAFQGVGSGTVVDYVQVHRNADDGIEFFGGTVNARHLVLTDIEDDSVDWTQGWQGKLQYVLVQQIQDDTVDTDRGMELDNLEQNNDAEPRSGGVMANFTLVGKTGELGINPRRGTGGNFSNFLVTGFSRCLDIDSTATFDAAGMPPFPDGLTGVLTMENTVLDCDTDIVEDDEDTPDPWSVTDWFDSQGGNSRGDSLGLDSIFPPEGAEWASGYELNMEYYHDDFFEDVDFVGAFRSRDSAWIWNWTEFYDW
jgi:hypothetical protein